MLKVVTFFLSLNCIACNQYAQQVHEIIYGDTNYMNPGERWLGSYVLKDSLPDGKWIVYEKPYFDDTISSEDQDYFEKVKKRNKISFIANYENSVRNGKMYFFLNGVEHVMSEYKYHNGVLHGKAIIWYNDKFKASETIYRHGKIAGEKHWNKEGDLIRIDIFKDGIYIKSKDKNGNIIKLELF